MQVSSFLDMCQQLVIDAGISGEITNTEDQVGEFRRVVDWVSRATTVIEGMFFNWNFLHVFHEFDTIVGVFDYPPPSDLNLWDWQTFQLPDQEETLRFEPWVRLKRDPTAQFSGDPWRVTVLPNKTLRIYDTPTDIQKIAVEYWTTPTVLIANADVPKIPVQFRDVIVYKALQYYANYESAEESKIEGLEQYEPRLKQLRASELPGNQASDSVNTGSIVEVSAGPIDGFGGYGGYGGSNVDGGYWF